MTLLVLSRIVYSPYGRRFRAVREDTIAAQAIGITVLPTRLSAFMVGAFFAGVGGSLYGHYLGSFSPAGFYMAYTFSLITMLVIGGMQSLTGAVVGVIVGHAAERGAAQSRARHSTSARCRPASLRGEPDRARDHLHSVMIFRPSGIMGDRELVARADCRHRNSERHQRNELMKRRQDCSGSAVVAGSQVWPPVTARAAGGAGRTPSRSARRST